MIQQPLRTRRDYGNRDTSIVDSFIIDTPKEDKRTRSGRTISFNKDVCERVTTKIAKITCAREALISRVAGTGNWNDVVQYKVGDIVYYVLGGTGVYGIVTAVNDKSSEIEVFWSSGSVKQHTSDDVALMPFVDDSVRSRLESLAFTNNSNGEYCEQQTDC